MADGTGETTKKIYQCIHQDKYMKTGQIFFHHEDGPFDEIDLELNTRNQIYLCNYIESLNLFPNLLLGCNQSRFESPLTPSIFSLCAYF